MLKHKLLHVSSRSKSASSASNSDFSVYLNSANMEGVKSVVVKQISIPNTMYNVNTYNRHFTYKIAGVASTISIRSSNYDFAGLKVALEAAGVGIGLTMTLDSISDTVTLATTTDIEYLGTAENPMAEVLGIEDEGSLGLDVASWIMSNTINLKGLTNVFVLSSTLAEANMTTSTGRSVHCLAMVPIDTVYGVVSHYASPHSDIDDVDSGSIRHGRNIQKFDIRIVDSQFRTLVLNGHHVDMVLKVFL